MRDMSLQGAPGSKKGPRRGGGRHLVVKADLGADQDHRPQSQYPTCHGHPHGRRGSIEALGRPRNRRRLRLAGLGCLRRLGRNLRGGFPDAGQGEARDEPARRQEGQHVDGDHALDEVRREGSRD